MPSKDDFLTADIADLMDKPAVPEVEDETEAYNKMLLESDRILLDFAPRKRRVWPAPIRKM